MQKLSNVFKEAKRVLWDGVSPQRDSKGRWLEDYICHAIERTATNHCTTAKAIILHRLGWNKQIDCANTVESYLTDVLGVSLTDAGDPRKVQKYRKDWLTSLEKEFKELEDKFPNTLYHIDGNVNNYDLSNLVEIV